MFDLTVLDYIYVGVLLASTIWATVRGGVFETIATLSWVVAAVSARFASPWLDGFLQSWFDLSESTVGTLVASYFIVFFAILLLVGFINQRLRDKIRDSIMNVTDKTLGVIFGIARGVVVMGVFYWVALWYYSDTSEMKEIARYFGKEYLNDINPDDFYANIPALRKLGNDRSVLRAFHFLNENARVPMMVNALENNDFDGFLKLVGESGNSSYKYLQNTYANSDPTNQEIPLSLALADKFLAGKGVCRVHGGGFAGTIQAYVKNEDIEAFTKLMTDLFGEGCVYALHIRKQGGTCVLK